MKRIFIILLLCAPAWATWTLTNDKSVTAGTPNPQITPAFTNALTNPSILIVFIYSPGSTITTPTDTAGHTFLDCGPGKTLWNASGRALQCFYVNNTNTTASDVVSEANSGFLAITIDATEWTGGATSSPLDVNATHPNGATGGTVGQNMTSNAATTTVSGELVVGFGNCIGVVTTGTGFTTLSQNLAEYQIQSSAGSIAATYNCNANANYGALMATFKLAAGGASGHCAACDISDLWPLKSKEVER